MGRNGVIGLLGIKMGVGVAADNPLNYQREPA